MSFVTIPTTTNTNSYTKIHNTLLRTFSMSGDLFRIIEIEIEDDKQHKVTDPYYRTSRLWTQYTVTNMFSYISSIQITDTIPAANPVGLSACLLSLGTSKNFAPTPGSLSKGPRSTDLENKL